MARDPGAYIGKEKERDHVGGTDVKPLRLPDDERAQYPHDYHWWQIITPLNAQTRYRLRSENQQHADTEVRWIPEVAALEPQDIFRGNRKHTAQGIGPH